MVWDDIPKSELRECLNHNLSLAIQNIHENTDKVLAQAYKILYPKQVLDWEIACLEKRKKELEARLEFLDRNVSFLDWFKK